MTITSAPPTRDDYTGNASTDTYAYTFRITDESHLRVTTRSAAGVETALALTTDYTVTGVGLEAGGTIVLTAGNLANNVHLTIRPNVPLTQTTDLRNQGKFRLDTQEDIADRIVRMIQQESDRIDRSLKLSETVAASGFDPTLPPDVSDNPLKVLLINSTGDGISLGAALIPAGGLIVTSYMETLLDDATAFAARLTLGITHHGYWADSGTADAMVITPSPAITAYAVGQEFLVKKSAASNTGAVTLNVNGLGAKSIKNEVGDDPIAGEIPLSSFVQVVYDGTNFILVSLGPYIASGTGAVARSRNDKARERLSVTDFGAIPDAAETPANAAINIAAIQACFDAVSAGDEVFFPNGSYWLGDGVAGRLYITKELTLAGEGWGTELKWDTTAWTDDVGSEAGRAALNIHEGAGVPVSSLTNSVMRNLAFDFGGTKTSVFVEGQRGIHWHTVNNVQLYGCKFKGGTGFMLMNTGAPQPTLGQIDHCYFTDTASVCINFTCDEFTMSNCYVYDCDGGPEIGAPKNTSITGNIFRDMLSGVIQVDSDHFVISNNIMNNVLVTAPVAAIGAITVQAGGGTAPASNGKITNNVITTPTDSQNRTGILLQRGTATSDHLNTDVSGNTVIGPHFGVRHNSGNGTKISGNLLRGRNTGVGVGVNIESNQVQSLNVEISGNNIKNYAARTAVATTNGPIAFSTTDLSGHMVLENAQEDEWVFGIANENFLGDNNYSFVAGDFTGAGAMTWTVAAGDVTSITWQIAGKDPDNRVMFLQFGLSATTVGGTPSTDLQLTLPGSVTVKRRAMGACYVSDNGTPGAGRWFAAAGGTIVAFRRINNANWAAATDATDIEACMVIPIE